MGGLDIKRKIQPHIVGNAVFVAVCIVGHVFAIIRVVILSGRQRRRTACGVVEVARKTVSLGKLEVEHGLHLMRSVVFRRIPLAIVQRHGHALVVLTEQGA